MSVVKSKRSVSHMEVMSQATDIRKRIEILCARNLGIRDPDNLARRKYKIGKDINFLPLRYYEHLCNEKENVRLLAYQAQYYLVCASKVRPMTKEEVNLRRNGQDLAIGTYEMLIREFQHVCDIFDVDINIYKDYIDRIDHEIHLLKSWRRSDNRIRRALD